MIAFLKGEILQKNLDSLILNVNNVGYELFSPLSTLSVLENSSKSEVQLYVKTVVREDSITLYGFLTEEEKNLFNMLLSVSKVGPKLALSILSGLAPKKIIRAIKERDIKLLSSIPGLGSKIAERVCFDLKDKLQGVDISPDDRQPSSTEGKEQDLISALLNLGYKLSEIKLLVSKIVKSHPEKSIENLLKEILNELYNV